MDFGSISIATSQASRPTCNAATAKVWLHDATVARSMGFSAQNLGKIQRMVKSHQSFLKEAWNAFFGT